MASLKAFSRVMSYSGSKAAVDQMMKVMALEWGPHQVITPIDRTDSSVTITTVVWFPLEQLLDRNMSLEYRKAYSAYHCFMT